MRYVLMNRVRELQGYKPRIEELELILISPISFRGFFQRGVFDDGDEKICKVVCFQSGPFEDTYPVLNDFTRLRSFEHTGIVVRTNPNFPWRPDLEDPVMPRAFNINQWILMLQAFFDEMSAKCTTASVALIQSTKRTDPVTRKMRRLLIDPQIEEQCLLEAKLMLDDLRAKRDEWTLELEGLRRELDHMGDKMLALITDLSLNR